MVVTMHSTALMLRSATSLSGQRKDRQPIGKGQRWRLYLVEVKRIKPKIEKAVVNGLQAGTAYECWVALESQILSEHCSQTSVALTTTS